MSMRQVPAMLRDMRTVLNTEKAQEGETPAQQSFRQLKESNFKDFISRLQALETSWREEKASVKKETKEKESVGGKDEGTEKCVALAEAKLREMREGLP